MNIEEALAILGAVGSENSPTAAQLSSARTVVVEAARLAKQKKDKKSLASLAQAIKAFDLAIEEAEELESKGDEELESLVKDLPELADETTEEVEEEEAPVPTMLSASELVQRLGIGSTNDAPAEVNERPMQTLTINGEEANEATWSSLGEAFAKNSKRSMRSGRTTLATFRTEYAHQLSGKPGENSRILDDLTRQSSDPAIIAAGGCCSLAEPIRDQPMLASLARPIAAALPTIGASSGKVSFYAPVCLPTGGVAAWTCDQDASVDPDDPTTWKQCEHIECADAQEVTVEAIYKCLTIGNFQHRFASERWDAILHATSAAQARLAEQTLFNQIRDSEYTTQHTMSVDTGSVYGNVIKALLTGVATIRQNQRYEGARFKTILPSWVRDASELDLLARAIRRGRSVEADNLETILNRANVDVVWSPDINPIEPNGQVDGPLTDFPDEASAVLWVDGGAFRLDGGELNLGTEIRDHDLNRQNSVAAFSESFEAAVVRSCDTKHITIPTPVCDVSACVDEVVDEGTGE